MDKRGGFDSGSGAAAPAGSDPAMARAVAELAAWAVVFLRGTMCGGRRRVRRARGVPGGGAPADGV